MPGENVSFIAFGQNHTDANALRAVRERLKGLHKELADKGRELVIGVEHGEGDVQKSQLSISSHFNGGLILNYREEAQRKGEKASLEDFLSKHAGEVDLRTAEHIPPLPEKPSTRDLERRERQVLEAMRGPYSWVESDVGNTMQMGKGAARMEEARLLQWALDNNVTVQGLDPISDEEKRERVSPEGVFDGAALEDMEYERVQGMGQKSVAIMKDLAQVDGGCLVAINIGTVHLASLEVVLQQELQANHLDKARTQVCALVCPEDIKSGMTPELAAKEMMNMGPEEMRRAQPRLEERISEMSEELLETEQTLNALEEMLSRAKALPRDDQALRKLLKTSPETVASDLSKNLASDSLKLSTEQVEELGRELEREPGKDAWTMLTSPLAESVKQGRIKLDEDRSELQKLRVHQKAMIPFAERVELRVEKAPPGVLKSYAQDGSSHQYDLSSVSALERGKSVRDMIQNFDAPTKSQAQTVSPLSTGAHVKTTNPGKTESVTGFKV